MVWIQMMIFIVMTHLEFCSYAKCLPNIFFVTPDIVFVSCYDILSQRSEDE